MSIAEMVEWLIEASATALEVSGIVVITIGAGISTLNGLASYLEKEGGVDIYTTYRRQLSRAILLGLEFLVAGDIIRTVAIEPTFNSVGVLAAIVLIRTFLSFTLEVEVTGKWPWSHGEQG
jgi:uncharacterized membrane protein